MKERVKKSACKEEAEKMWGRRKKS